MRRLLLIFAFVAAAVPALAAVDPDEILEDPRLEQKAREIAEEIRCVVCQSESIVSSNAEIAKAMRILIRERVKAGDSEEEVKAFLVARYGDYVLLNPPVKPATYLLWFGPFLVLLGGLLAVLVYMRRQARSAASGASVGEPLSEAEQARLMELTDEDGEDGRRS